MNRDELEANETRETDEPREADERRGTDKLKENDEPRETDERRKTNESRDTHERGELNMCNGLIPAQVEGLSFASERSYFVQAAYNKMNLSLFREFENCSNSSERRNA
ncbi:unnamed protein product [Cyprideis torosa]|uniref:Uncharacterized protein n=1 Tax=Cyprideis torosa TaxID=163714 RepID=A0A7R8ZQP1_9CRUS|nr:unnamed protein product [Cyprideis torosa]CAG0891163.1 unnamed protein product [Cyprideis torosa]